MNYSKINISGLRGFSEIQTINLGIPNGKEGSGLTIIVGPNSSGKSTIYEAVRALSSPSAPEFSSGQRNILTKSKVHISVTKQNGEAFFLNSKDGGGSATEFEPPRTHKTQLKFFTLPSRRGFSPFFSKDVWDRDQFTSNISFESVRSKEHDNFHRRLFKIQATKTTYDSFNLVLSKVLGQIPDWHMELSDNQLHYLKFENYGSPHNSDGMGEGILSVFTIVDALYDSEIGDLIFIDEPELSLHPSLQKKLLKLIVEYAKDRQIIISTHSPYFIDWSSIESGAQIVRTVKDQRGTKIHELQRSTANEVLTLLNDLNNPHTLGLDAKEVFFLDDKIILVEGQEDVIFFGKIVLLKGITVNGTFFGWGVGGASKMDKVLLMLKDLGFKKVAVIFDKNMSHLTEKLSVLFPEYLFTTIPTNDIRHKPDKNIEGIINSAGTAINEKFDKEISGLFTEVNTYLS